MGTIAKKPTWRPIFARSPRHQYAGKLIAFEGIDGAGKTTLITGLSDYLKGTGKETLIIRSPSSDMRTYWAWKAWHISKDKPANIDELGLTIMALGDRLIVQKAIVIPALERGAFVLADRYTLSVLAYWGTKVHRFVAERLLAPDFGFFLDVEPDIAIQRLLARDYESKNLHDYNLLKKLRRRYTKLTPFYDYRNIDTNGSCEDSLNKLVSILS